MWAAIIASLVFVGLGILFLLFPRTVYKYDQRMVRYFKSFEEYRVALFVLAIGCIFLGLAAFELITMGVMK